MDDEALQASYDRFGLSPEASMSEVERSFRELRNLYSEESLATYSLLGDTDRQEKIESLQAAYDRILQSRLQVPTVEVDNQPIQSKEEAPAVESQIVYINADPQQRPGLFLQQTRKARGLSLQDVAERTKIRLYHLQSIEEQHFDALPAPVYLRGFLKEFSRVVKVPEIEALVDSFMTLYLSDK